MELYTDLWLFLEYFLFNILLGILFIYMMRIAYRMGVLAYGITLLILNYLFFMPRSSFTESFYSLFTMQFWFFITVLFIISGLLVKRVGYYSHTRMVILMFEKYSFADLIANTVKNKKWNLIGFIVLFLAMAVPLSLKTINSTAVVRLERELFFLYCL